jgi:phytoene dehydrogenase-like protein
MEDYDVIIVGGGGITGLTVAAYCAKSGLKTLVLEKRGECGTHCDTVELGLPGFVHNTHATWLMNAISPVMYDLNLCDFGLEMFATEHAYAHSFLDGTNAIQSIDPVAVIENWGKHSAKDARFMELGGVFFMDHFDEFRDIFHRFLHHPPSENLLKELGNFVEGFCKEAGINLTWDKIYNMTGYELLDHMFESEKIKLMCASWSLISAFYPAHKTVGALGVLLTALGTVFKPVHTARGGSHALTHALVKAATANGVKILPCCPVSKIIVENNEAKGVVLSPHAVFANEKIYGKKIVSNVSLVPTFLDLIGEDVIGSEMAKKIAKFNYDEQGLFCINIALGSSPQFASAEFDDAVQKSWMGYFGGQTTKEAEAEIRGIINRTIPEIPMANYYIPTWADPSQAPEGCHTMVIWSDTPTRPLRWKGRSLKGTESWDDIKEELADGLIDEIDKFAPGLKNSILERFIYTPLDIWRNNPSAVYGCWCCGATSPGQFYLDRPLPGIRPSDSMSRTFIKNLHLSQSIPLGNATFLSCAYAAAKEIVEAMDAFDPDIFKAKMGDWIMDHLDDIPVNRGVR